MSPKNAQLTIVPPKAPTLVGHKQYKQPFSDPFFLLEAGGILAEACYDLFIKDKSELSPRFKRLHQAISAGVLGWRIFSKVRERYCEYDTSPIMSDGEDWTEIKFKHTDPMLSLTKRWILKYTSFVDPSADTLIVELKDASTPPSSIGAECVYVSKSEDNAIEAAYNPYSDCTLDNCVIPNTDVVFKWRGLVIEFTLESKQDVSSTLDRVNLKKLADADAKDFKVIDAKNWKDALTPWSSLRISTRDRTIIDELFAEIKEGARCTSRQEAPVPCIYEHLNVYSEWTCVMPVPARAAILPETYDTALVEDVRSFFANKEWYKSVAVPHRRGYMFYGLPGTGKTSTIITLARQASLDVYVINLNRMNSAKKFAQAVHEATCGSCSGSILVFEDIDCVLSQRDLHVSLGGKEAATDSGIASDAEPTLSFSDFLNVIDGISSREDQIIIMTTNKGLDDFDPALMRPGRIDVKVHFTHATNYQIQKLIERFVPEDEETAKKLFQEITAKGSCTMCQVQEHLIQWHFGQTKKLGD